MATFRNQTNRLKRLDTTSLRSQGTQVFVPSRTIKVQPADDDSIITVNEGDRMDALASKYYGSPSLWYVIASVNNLAKGDMHIRPGLKIRIPAKNRIV